MGKKEKAAQEALRKIEMRVRKVEGMLDEAINQHERHEKSLAEKRDEGMEYLNEELQMISQVRELLATIRNRPEHRMDGKEYRPAESGASGSAGSVSDATGSTGATGAMEALE